MSVQDIVKNKTILSFSRDSNIFLAKTAVIITANCETLSESTT